MMKKLITAVAGIGAIVALTGAPVAASAATSTWTVQPTPLPSGATNGTLQSVRCFSANSCTVVGDFIKKRTEQPLGGRWDGSSWSSQATPLPSGATGGVLWGIACATATNCFAVGGSYSGPNLPAQPLAEQWNGSTWSLVSMPSPAGSTGASLAAASCVSATNCTAVGNYQRTSGANTLVRPLAESWNGTTWSIQSTSEVTDGPSMSLTGVSCTSSKSCLAVGKTSTVALAERWNGKKWSVLTIPDATGVQLNAISCAAATNCTAVGSADVSGTADWAEWAGHWDGSSWSTQTMPVPAGSMISQLNGVSCATAVHCTAVGWSTKNYPHALDATAEQWNGSTWKVESTAQPATHQLLQAISCPAATVCAAVGALALKGPSLPDEQPLAEQS
ncbi:MAG TPA: hypothetical protein VGH27_06915 [Streptosporangiaceae bacterium]